ncbi:MAG: hypothetical protein NC389_16955 [Acetatifactor muris]|nr:hypothetical protein [Acetatifactor muris]
MFSLDVVDTDRFLGLPTRAQCLYFHLGMLADDDGFLSVSPKLLRRSGCGTDDLDMLADAGYIIRFENEIIAIRDWNINNHIPQRQYTPTEYQRERSGLALVNGMYRLIQE